MIQPTGVRIVLAGQNSARATADLIEAGLQCQDAGYVEDRDELAKLYAAADIFLFASPAENFPCVILEAMASGCCVVATPTGGVVEQIEHGCSGLLARSISSETLGIELQIALASRELRLRLGSAARERVWCEFSESLMIERHLELYREIINEN